jgi:hypothetical protein
MTVWDRKLHFETPVGEKVRKIFGFCYVLKLAAEQNYRTSRLIEIERAVMTFGRCRGS